MTQTMSQAPPASATSPTLLLRPGLHTLALSHTHALRHRSSHSHMPQAVGSRLTCMTCSNWAIGRAATCHRPAAAWEALQGSKVWSESAGMLTVCMRALRSHEVNPPT